MQKVAEALSKVVRQEDISRAAEILAVVDIFVEMAGGRPDSNSGEAEEVLVKIEGYFGSFFQQEIVDKLNGVVKETGLS